MAQDIVYLKRCPLFPCKESAFCCCWVEFSINVNWINLVGSIAQVFYILLIFCLLILSIIVRSIEISNCNSGCISLFAVLSTFTSFLKIET